MDTDIIDDLRDEADLCRNEGAEDIARLLDAAVAEIERLRKIERINKIKAEFNKGDK